MKYWMKLCTDFYTENKRRPTWQELAVMIGNCDAEGIKKFAQKQASISGSALFYFKLVERATESHGQRLVDDIEI